MVESKTEMEAIIQQIGNLAGLETETEINSRRFCWMLSNGKSIWPIIVNNFLIYSDPSVSNNTNPIHPKHYRHDLHDPNSIDNIVKDLQLFKEAAELLMNFEIW